MAQPGPSEIGHPVQHRGDPAWNRRLEQLDPRGQTGRDDQDRSGPPGSRQHGGDGKQQDVAKEIRRIEAPLECRGLIVALREIGQGPERADEDQDRHETYGRDPQD